VEQQTLPPLAIFAMRQRDYPGSDLVIERTLSPGRNYQQYVASYQSDGMKIFALLTVPNGAKPATGWPVIIFNHGYIPPTVYRTTERYVAYVDAFARNGYIVFKPDYRGFGSSQGTPVSAYGSPNDTVDVLNAVTTMQRYANADPNRIGMWGHSMGGNITLRALVIDPRIKVAVIWAGVNATYKDLLENWHPTSGDRPPRPLAAAGHTLSPIASARPNRIRGSGTRSRRWPTWPTSPRRSSCTTAPAIPRCRCSFRRR